MPEWIAEIGESTAAVIILAYLIIKELIKLRSNGKSDKEKSYERLQKQVDDLWEWHDKETQDGVKLWYFPQSLIKEISHIKEDIASLKNKDTKK